MVLTHGGLYGGLCGRLRCFLQVVPRLERVGVRPSERVFGWLLKELGQRGDSLPGGDSLPSGDSLPGGDRGVDDAAIERGFAVRRAPASAANRTARSEAR